MEGTSAHIVWNEECPTTTRVIDVSFGGIALMADMPGIFPPSFQATREPAWAASS
jgi:hypothetical protein